MSQKPRDPKASDLPKVPHPGMMGDGTEEQNLDEAGDPAARIGKDELDATFGKKAPKKP